MYADACSNKDMEHYLDQSYTTNTGLQLPDFLKIKETSPGTSPTNSPLMPRNINFMPLMKRAHSARELVRLRDESKKKAPSAFSFSSIRQTPHQLTSSSPANRDSLESVENGVAQDGEGAGSSVEDSPDADADTENSDSETTTTPTLTRPNNLPTELLVQHDTFLSPEDVPQFQVSPHSPSPQAINIMAFDDELDEDENPANPSTFGLSGISASSTLPKRKNKKHNKTSKFDTLTKVMTGRVTKLQQDLAGQASSEEESGPDDKAKKGERKKSKGSRFFGKS